MRAALVLVVCACNPAFGLHDTTRPPPDALPTSCPPIGTPPRFSGTYRQVLTQPCGAYSPSFTTRAVLAECQTDARTNGIFTGSLDESLVQITIPLVSPVAALEQPRLAPDGNFALIDNSGFDSLNGDEIALYQRVDAMTWQLVGDSGLPRDFVPLVGSLTRGPDYHVIFTGMATFAWTEYARQSNGTWQPLATTATFGMPNYYGSANLTSDGLRVIVPGDLVSYYADRPSIDAPFGPLVPLEGAPGAADNLMLSDDCTRLYFTGVERVFYVEQI